MEKPIAEVRSPVATEPMGTWINGALLTMFNIGTETGRNTKSLQDRLIVLVESNKVLVKEAKFLRQKLSEKIPVTDSPLSFAKGSEE